jgi:hypothetical protein
MVPPWVPDPEFPDPSSDDAPSDSDLADSVVSVGHENTESPDLTTSQPRASAPVPFAPIAPPGRFGGARLSLGNFARTGNSDDMRRGLGRYVQHGYGGDKAAVRRFGGTISTAGALYGALSGVTEGETASSAGSALDPLLLIGRSAREVMDAVIEAVRPADGTQDAEASRAAVRDALSELLTMFPDADLLHLSEEQRVLVIERFVDSDVYRRFFLDVGKQIQDKAPTASTCLARLKEINDYIKETVAGAFRKVRAAGGRLTTARVKEIVRNALSETFNVFESYVQ